MPRKLALLFVAFVLITLTEAWAFHIPPVGAVSRHKLVSCTVADHFTGTVEPDSQNAYIDFSETADCSHVTNMETIHGTMYLDGAPSESISKVCTRTAVCHETDYLTSTAPVTLQLKSNWAITLPRGFAFDLKTIPGFCTGKKRVVICHHISLVKTLA